MITGLRVLSLVLFGIVGAAVGSFLNIVADRVPSKQSLVRPPSHCPECSRRLSVFELLPIISYLVLRGRCRTCGARIPSRVLWVEIATGLLYVLLLALSGFSWRLLLNTIWASLLICFFVIDIEHRIVPNVMVLPASVLALLAVPVQGWLTPSPFGHYAFLGLIWGDGALSLDQIGMVSQVIGGALSFAMFFVVWLIFPGGMGEGDVKLSLFCGLITAIPGAVIAVAGSWVLGGLVAVVILATRRGGMKTAIPFAPFLVISSLVVLILNDQLVAVYVGYLLG